MAMFNSYVTNYQRLSVFLSFFAAFLLASWNSSLTSSCQGLRSRQDPSWRCWTKWRNRPPSPNESRAGQMYSVSGRWMLLVCCTCICNEWMNMYVCAHKWIWYIYIQLLSCLYVISGIHTELSHGGFLFAMGELVRTVEKFPKGPTLVSSNAACWRILHVNRWFSGFKHGFYFPFHIWDVIPTPLTKSIFSRCLKPTTRFRSGIFPASHAWFPDGKRLRKALKPWSMSCISYGAHEHIIPLQKMLRMKEDTSIFGPSWWYCAPQDAVFTVFTEI